MITLILVKTWFCWSGWLKADTASKRRLLVCKSSKVISTTQPITILVVGDGEALFVGKIYSSPFQNLASFATSLHAFRSCLSHLNWTKFLGIHFGVN